MARGKGVESSEDEATPLDMAELQESLKDIQEGASSLLKQTKERRVSVIPKDGKNLDPAMDPWDINSPEELAQSIERDVIPVLEMIQTLREERDAGIHNAHQLDQYSMVIGHYEKEHTANKARILELEQAQGVYEIQEEEFNQLRDQLTASKQEIKDLKKAQRTQPQQEVIKTVKSTKIPDPPVFTNNDNPTWDEWYAKMTEKLIINTDHFPTESAKIIYALNRIGGDADKVTHNRRRKNATNPYQTLEDLFDHLGGLFEDQHREVTAEREYDELAMATGDSFRSFFYEFTRLADILDYGLDNRHVISSMKRKLPARLRDHLMDKAFTTMKEYRDYLYRLDDNQRADWKNKVKSKDIKETSRTVTTSTRRTPATSTALVPAASRAIAVSTRTPLQPSPDRNCWTCGKANCLPSQHPPNTPQSAAGRAAQLAIQSTRINEIGINEISDVEEDSGLDRVSSDEDTKN